MATCPECDTSSRTDPHDNRGAHQGDGTQPMELTELHTRLERIMGRRSLTLRFYDNGVINMTAPARQMTQEDMAAFRAVLAQYGYEEAESWIATQGVSWLSDGVFAGVSFRVRPA